VRFGRLGTRSAGDPAEAALSTAAASEPYVCPTLEKAVERSTKHGRPAVLTLGGADGPTITFLAEFGAKLTIEEFEPPPVRDPDDEAPAKPFKFDFPSRGYDLILLWEWADFFPKEALPELGLELARISRPGATLLLLSRSSFDGKFDRPMRYKIHDERTVSRKPLPGASRPRFVHPTRTLELALKRFSISGIHLQRDQTREILAVRKA